MVGKILPLGVEIRPCKLLFVGCQMTKKMVTFSRLASSVLNRVDLQSSKVASGNFPTSALLHVLKLICAAYAKTFHTEGLICNVSEIRVKCSKPKKSAPTNPQSR